MAKNDWRFTKQAIKEGSLSAEDEIAYYNRFRRIKNARITRLEKAFPRAEVLKNVERAPKVEELMVGNELDRTAFSNEFAEAYKFGKRGTTTITGYRRQLKRSIRTFNELVKDKKKGKVFNEENIFDLYDFLEDYRDKNNVQKIPDSDRIIDIYAEGVERLSIDPESLLEDVDYWREHYKEMGKLQPPEDSEPVDSDYYKNQLK